MSLAADAVLQYIASVTSLTPLAVAWMHGGAEVMTCYLSLVRECYHDITVIYISYITVRYDPTSFCDATVCYDATWQYFMKHSGAS